ncbi:carboxypeptidase-like regulatory domain-containing protein [Occallatibacter savannae]|uniref:carboxypeptidase-like regulatory domain-containing protein n=1 Tax=Occallatibacter savannae TaxID=1002691 RepID=UPI0013A5A8B4|nr:carboxypeptidase regulatory-like domain-containing protein [Occallatibacter savannae]
MKLFPIPKECAAQLRRSKAALWAMVFVAIASLISLAPQTAFAQASAGITGTITDPTGAVIPNAKVTITNEQTSVSSDTVSSSAGTYSFRGLLPGRYTVQVDASGFKKDVKKGVTIEVSTTATVDFALTTGGSNETVQVTSDEIALNTTAPEIGSTIEPVVVAALPEEVSGRGRQIDQLQFTAPGTTGGTFSHRVSGGVDFEQEIVYNGIPTPQPETEGYTTNFNPPFELVQEYKVERSTFSAQFGLGQGALTYQMKSGTNSYHGDLFEINRNSFFDSVGFFNGPAWGGSKTPPSDHENNYGFSVGGPIRIPHIYDGRNRTFGYYSQEWYKQNNLNTGIGTVPTAAEKGGDFSDYVDTNGKLIPIYVPIGFSCNGLTPGQPFPGNKIPTNCISPLSSSLLQYLPNPDISGGLDSNKTYAHFINPNIQHVWGFTVDQNISARQSLHYSQWRNSYTTHSFDYAPIVLAPNPLNSQKYEPALGSAFLLNYSNTFNPHLVMTAGFGWIGEINNQFNITKGYQFGAVQNEDIPPNITFDGQHAPTSWGTSGAWLQSINRKLGIALVNNYLWTKGRNTFNIGWEYRRAYQDDNEEQTEGGHFNFSQRTTSVQNSNDPNFGSYGSSFASFLLGIPDSANRSNSQELKLRNRDFSPYLQDDIKLTPRLTVNLGLRWDIQVPFTEDHNNVVFFNPDNPGTLPGENIPGQANKLGSCNGCVGWNHVDTHWNHLGPRFGFAYQLSRKMVLQAGVDVAFLDGGAYEYGTNKVAVNYGNLLVGSYTRNSTGSYNSSFGSWDTNSIPAVSPTPFSPSLGRGNQINAMSKKTDGKAPYSEQWNVNLQRELPYNMLATVAWVGNRIIHLPSQNNHINQLDPKYLSLGSKLNDVFAPGQTSLDGVPLPYPDFVTDFGGSATVAQALVPYPQYSNIFYNFEAMGTTYYQSAQIEVEKRFSNGLSFLAGYTLSRLYDNTSSGFSSFTSGGINKYNQKPEWAISNADEPQTLKVSGTYMLPIGPGKKFVNNRKLGNVVGGWQVGWILDYEAGGAFGPYENGTPFPNGFNRPDRNSSVKLGTASYNRARDYFLGKIPAAQMFDQSAFTLTPSQYVLGDAKRNYPELRYPAFYNENLNAKKHFYIGERFTTILSVDYFNALNRTIFNGPDTNKSDASFGQVTGKGSNTSNRQGQVSLRLEF